MSFCSGTRQDSPPIWEMLVKHPKLKVRVTPTSADAGVCSRECSPRNRTPKGPTINKVIDLNGQIDLFGWKSKGTPAGDSEGYSVWELLVYDDGNDVRAELSRPVVFTGGYFVEYSERIFLIDDGEWSEIELSSPDEGGEDDIDIDVRRKN